MLKNFTQKLGSGRKFKDFNWYEKNRELVALINEGKVDEAWDTTLWNRTPDAARLSMTGEVFRA